MQELPSPVKKFEIMSKIEIKNVYKIFGPQPAKVLPMVKEGAKKAKPVLLEPVMKVEAVTPGDYLGDVTGDLNRRRGIIQGMEETVVGNIIKAEVPLSEMFGYATDLRSMTQGRATYTMEFEKYAEIPSNIAEELIEKAS